MEDDLGNLCNELISKGVQEREILKMSKKCGVSSFTVLGTDAYEILNIVEFFGFMVTGGIIGSYIGYVKSGGNVGAAVLGELGCALVGGLCYASGQEYYLDDEKEMLDELKNKYCSLLDSD